PPPPPPRPRGAGGAGGAPPDGPIFTAFGSAPTSATAGLNSWQPQSQTRAPVSLRIVTATVVDASGARVTCAGCAVVVSLGAAANTATPITLRLLLPVWLSK